MVIVFLLSFFFSWKEIFCWKINGSSLLLIKSFKDHQNEMNAKKIILKKFRTH